MGEEKPNILEQYPRLEGETPEDWHTRLQSMRDSYVPSTPRVEIVAGQTHDKTQKILDEVRQTGEPIFVLRGKDILSVMAIASYQEALEKYVPREHTLHGQVGEIHDQMLDWQRANMDKVRYPD